MKYFASITAVVLGGLTPLTYAQGYGNTSVTHAGDLLQVLLPLSAYATAAYLDDIEGAKQYTKALALNMTAVEILKKTTRQWRPDHSSQLSFPSGHAAAALSAAAFVRQRYDTSYSIPFYALGVYTGYTRVQAKKHYWHDVVGSFLVSELSQHLFAKRFEKNPLFFAVNDGKTVQMIYSSAW